jgi:hypothetical protein
MESGSQKISAGMRARLDRMPRGAWVRAVVVLNTGASDHRGRRQGPEEREAAVTRMKAAAAELLPQLDSVLSEGGGRRLSDSPMRWERSSWKLRPRQSGGWRNPGM